MPRSSADSPSCSSVPGGVGRSVSGMGGAVEARVCAGQGVRVAGNRSDALPQSSATDDAAVSAANQPRTCSESTYSQQTDQQAANRRIDCRILRLHDRPRRAGVSCICPRHLAHAAHWNGSKSTAVRAVAPSAVAADSARWRQWAGGGVTGQWNGFRHCGSEIVARRSGRWREISMVSLSPHDPVHACMRHSVT